MISRTASLVLYGSWRSGSLNSSFRISGSTIRRVRIIGHRWSRRLAGEAGVPASPEIFASSVRRRTADCVVRRPLQGTCKPDRTRSRSARGCSLRGYPLSVERQHLPPKVGVCFKLAGMAVYGRLAEAQWSGCVLPVMPRSSHPAWRQEYPSWVASRHSIGRYSMTSSARARIGGRLPWQSSG